MKKYIYLAFIGLIGLFASCEKEGTKVEMFDNPIAPTIKTLPDLTLLRANATDTLKIVGTPLNPGFVSSATYYLEACPAGDGFENKVIVYSGVQDTAIIMTVSDINGMLLKKFTADAVSSADFRIRAVMLVDAGTGAWGTSTDPMVYTSEDSTVDITTYGLPRLDLLNSGRTQKIESALGNGKYKGFVKLNTANPFTLKDPDTNIEYGGSAGTLAVSGSAIAPAGDGWYRLSADITALTYDMEAFMIGLVGSATPNGWGSPDSKMDYDAQSGTWSITTDLVDGEIKFRKNDGWSWNLGGTADKLEHNGSNIAVTAGNYTITLTITNETAGSEAGTCTIVKN